MLSLPYGSMLSTNILSPPSMGLNMAACGYPSEPNSNSGDYFFYIEGLPSNYTWKKLKDLARKEAPNLGWTEMEKRTVKDRGWIRVKRQNEAYNLYDFLKNNPLPNRQLRVYLWQTTKSPPELLACNSPVPQGACDPFYSQSAMELQINLAATQTDDFIFPRISPVQSAPPRLSVQQPMLAQHNYVLPSRGQVSSPSQHAPSFQARANPPHPHRPFQPAYVQSNSNGLPINIGAGCVTTESRGIFLSGLHFNTTQDSLDNYLGTAGVLESCEIQTSSSGASRGHAVAKFTTKEAAANAVKLLNGRKFDGKIILVRFDKEEDALNAASRQAGVEGKRRQNGIVIANGSNDSDE